jgi:hypothetical protein
MYSCACGFLATLAREQKQITTYLDDPGTHFHERRVTCCVNNVANGLTAIQTL